MKNQAAGIWLGLVCAWMAGHSLQAAPGCADYIRAYQLAESLPGKASTHYVQDYLSQQMTKKTCGSRVKNAQR